MFIPELRYGMFVAFLVGVNEATGNVFLRGFNSWVGKKMYDSENTSLVWSSMIAGRYDPNILGGKGSIVGLSAQADGQATADLFEMLNEFLDRPIDSNL